MKKIFDKCTIAVQQEEGMFDSGISLIKQDLLDYSETSGIFNSLSCHLRIISI